MGLLFISPWIAGFLIFLVYPIYYTIRISFTRYSGFGTPKWIGLGNYRALIHDDVFWTAVYNTLYYTALAVPVGVVVAMVLALAMNQPLPEVPIFRAIFYIPSVIPLFTLAFIFQVLMNPTQGIFNRILIWFGLPNINWFGDPRYAKLALVILAQYGAGQAAIVFLAALKGIPITLYEAASLDGATLWRRFWNITLPGLRATLLFVTATTIIGSFRVFGQVYVMTNGGPADASRTLVYHIYQTGFQNFRMGGASAVAWALFLIVAVFTLVQFRLLREKD